MENFAETVNQMYDADVEAGYYDEYIEKMASEKLGLIKSNAKVFVDVSGEQQ